MMTETVVNVQEAPNNNAANNKPQASSDSPLSWIKINVDYFKTVPGLLKIAEFILGIICMALASPAYWPGGSNYFVFVATTSFIFTLMWIVIYFLGIREALKIPINWLLSELVNTVIWTVLYIIAFIVQLIVAVAASNTYNRGSYIAAGVFGLFNTIVYALAAYLLYIEWKSSRTTN